MGRPQKSVVYAADATALGDMAKPLRESADKMLESAERARTTVYDFDWEGESKNAADGRMDREIVQDRAVGTAQYALADAYQNGKDTMQPMIDGLKSKGQGLEADNFDVSEDWVVTDTYNYAAGKMILRLMGATKEEADNALDPIQTQRHNTATTETSNLQRLADELGVADEDTARAINEAKAALADAAPQGVGQPNIVLVDDPLAPGGVRLVGPVAGTGADPGIPNIGAADLGEVIRLPNGKYVAIFGDSFSGNKVGEGDHYHSVAVPVRFENGKMVIDGPPLTGPNGSSNMLFPMPSGKTDNDVRGAQAAKNTDTLPAGTIRMNNGDTYVMVSGTNGLKPDGGSWLVKVTDNPGDPKNGWQYVENSWQPWTSVPDTRPDHAGEFVSSPLSQPTQISGYQGADDNVYIAADSFDRNQGVTMYRVDPEHVGDRGAWQPWTGNGWGTPGQVATAPVTEGGVTYGELSFQEVGGKAVLSGFNGSTGSVDLHVGDSPTSVFNGAPTVVAPGGHWDNPVPGTYPQNYGGYILPGSTLDNMGILVSQWNTDANTPYTVEQFQVNPNK